MLLNFRPYKTIWLNPKHTFKSFIIDRSNNSSIYYIPFLVSGISFGLSIGYDVSLLYDTNPRLSLKLVTFVLSSLIGISFVTFSFGLIIPYLTRQIGKIWNGAASTKELANVYSFSFIPYLLFIPYQCVLIAFGLSPTYESLNAGFQFLIWIISLRALIIGVSEVQKFNYGISLLNVLLTLLPFYIIRLIIGA